MHIQEIVVDGFKSYAHRTVIAGFDPHFNAITGLNGSGKSNILDSICFVLGITNLSQVRAGNLSELVYKQGQAGINKASVTVVFDNSDESKSPVGYEQCSEVTVTRQVLIGGKSKYLINGRTSPAGQVANLFHSVQLNVNNPHFLIMQGRITKVLNMKPNEILGMVEEAAGTRMYENKKLAAIKTIEKKQKKVEEINSVLSEEITPTLERLRKEKQHYLEWSMKKSEVERMEKFVVASEYKRAQDILQKNKDVIEELDAEVKRNEDIFQQCNEEIKQKEEEIESLTTQLNGQYGSEHKESKSEEEKLSKKLVKTTSAWQNSLNNVEKATEDLNAANALRQETKEARLSKEREINDDNGTITRAQQEATDAEQEVERLTKEYQNMCAGISSSEGDEAMTLPDQISKAHSDANNADARVKQATMKMKHLKTSIKAVEKDMKKEEKSAEKLAAQKEKLSQKVDTIKSKIKSINFPSQDFDNLENEKDDLTNSIGNLQDLVDTLTAQLQGRLSFNYSDPVRGFDRSKVKGMIARLIHVKESKHATALEVVAGGRLYQVVVDEAITGKALLSRGQLQRRVTIIPLDKIQSKGITNAAVNTARSMADKMQTEASPAIELVGFDEEVRNALEYVFGSTLIVDGTEAANKICDATKTRTVTLDGDVYDPSGTISGGSKNNLGTTLSKLTELTSSSTELAEKQKRLEVVTKKIDELGITSRQFENLNNQLELSTAELTSVEKHLSQTSFGMLLDKFNKMKQEMDEASTEAQEMELEKETKLSLYNELQEKETELTRNREEKLKDIEQKVTAAKRMASEMADKTRVIESQSQTLELELDSLIAEVTATEEAVKAAEKAVHEANRIEEDLQMKVGEIKAQYDEALAKLKLIEEKMTSCNSDLKKLSKERTKLTKTAEAAELDVKKKSIKVTKFHKDISNAEKHIVVLDKKYEWIRHEKEMFGKEGGDYDFEASDPSEMSHQLKSLQDEQTKLEKRTNKKVMGMIEKAEDEYSELMRKRRVVENDKKKIESVIEELDEKKKTELERTWVKVTRDFGSIFSTLLPGASAKLEPPEGMQAWEGLEVKVGFGGVWKESLSELSGGQRSLIALSLILSLLLFKPAPMYILDEVDAALDLSHTQNIGNMLKTHFSQSQFIVVSLKEGMFNNANVIFRTKFVDGVSTVTRTIGVGASSKARALLDSDNNIQENRETSNPKRTARSRQRSTKSTGIGKEN